MPEAPQSLDEPKPTPDVDFERGERIRAVYRLLEGLSEKKRSVLVLHDFEGMSAKDIAESVGAPILTVRTRLFYARKELYAAIASEPALAGLLDSLKLNEASAEGIEEAAGKTDEPAMERSRVDEAEESR